MKKLLVSILIFLLVVNMFANLSFSSSIEDILSGYDIADGYNTRILVSSNRVVLIADDDIATFPYFIFVRLNNTSNSSFTYFFSTTPITFFFENGKHYVSGRHLRCSYASTPVNFPYQYIMRVNKPSAEEKDDLVKYSFSDEYDFKSFIYSNHDVYDNNGKIVYRSNNFNPPNFINTKEELASGKFDTLKIDAGDLDLANDKFIFNIYKGTNISDTLQDYQIYKSFLLDGSSKYFYAANLNVYYHIPQSQLGIDLSNDKSYMFELKKYGEEEVYSSVSFTVGGLTEGEEIKNGQDITNDKLDEQTNAIKDQTEVMKEQTETNKNIFEKIGDILSYINPLSPNFFVYKLIELLVNAIKSLFIPSEEFFR